MTAKSCKCSGLAVITRNKAHGFITFHCLSCQKELGSIDTDYDPTPYCNACGARSAKNCDCGPIARND